MGDPWEVWGGVGVGVEGGVGVGLGWVDCEMGLGGCVELGPLESGG